MMLRETWEFLFVAQKLADAAANKKLHHEQRLKFWQDSKDKVMTEIKEAGIEVLESDAGSNYVSNRSFTPEVMVRNDLQKRLTEAHRKIIEHTDKANEYSGWIQVLSGNPQAQLCLHADDYLFFFGK